VSAHSRPSFPPRVTPREDARVLVLFCHPKRHRSRVNRALVEAIDDLPGVTVHDLYEAYPDNHIDVAHEQQLLLAHHTVVMQHPFYWYSTPPLLKTWLDVVLTWGWAYGKGGTAIRGKRLLQALTTGGGEAAYQHGGFNRFTIRELLAPMVQTAHLCGMDFLPPFVVHGTHALEQDGIITAAREYRAVIQALAEDRLPETARQLARLNSDLSWTLKVTS
jgi:glutathione-regulated potassium-efflux system ancillary protein KefG